VDDLEFAANFAFVTTPTTDSTPSTLPIHKPTTRMHPEETLDQDDQESDSSSDSSDEKDDTERGVDDDDDDDDDGVDEGNNDGEVDSSEDDESDVDLSKELAQMENEEDEPKHGSKSNRIVVPKTQNELDVYNCPVTELEKTLDLGLELGDVLVFEPAGSGLMTARVQVDRIRPAGNIKFHMVSDRTIVVESNPQGGLASASNRYDSNHSVKKPLLLDEGNLLLLKITKDNHPMIAKITDGSELKDTEVFVVPLGKILEVFGPVSKPLYTLRLPAVHPLHQRTPRKDALFKIKKEDNQDNDTTDLNKLVVEKLKDSMENSPNDKAAETSETIVSATKIENETVAQEHKGNVPIKNENIDPWSENGILTKWLKRTPKLEVFYCDDQVKVVDTQTVVKNSRKGCGKFRDPF
jgi:Gar1/Naf1 RNA binding region.